MDPTLIAVIVICIMQLTTVAIVCRYMHKNTLSIAAFKRASNVAEAGALLDVATQKRDENEDEQPQPKDFETIPGDMDTDSLRSQL